MSEHLLKITPFTTNYAEANFVVLNSIGPKARNRLYIILRVMLLQSSSQLAEVAFGVREATLESWRLGKSILKRDACYNLTSVVTVYLVRCQLLRTSFNERDSLTPAYWNHKKKT